MTQPARPSRLRIAVAGTAAAAVAAVPAALTALPAGAAEDAAAGAASAPSFTRIDIDTGISGASFTSVGSVFAGEQDIVTSGYGALDAAGRPVGGGTLQVYRPGATLKDWTKVTVFGPGEDIVFPNATTIDDVDGDGDNDIIVPSGYFFGTDPAATPLLSGAITWWENKGAGAAFVRHNVVTGQAGSYHGVQFVDLDKDGKKDLLSVSEEAKQAGNQEDDTVAVQFFKGTGGGAFAPPVELARNVGGSQPVVHDLDADGDLDIVSAQYFHLMNDPASAAPFLWLENSDTDGALTAADFTSRPIASFLNTSEDRGVGMGFQIRPVPGFRGPGTLSWIGTNHVNRCTIPGPFSEIPEEVIEFLPTADLDARWKLNSLSDIATPPPACPSDYNSGDYVEFSDQITSRYGYGQGAPGVFGYGDIDGDQDVDLLVSGDGDRRLWWIENLGGGNTTLHRLTGAAEYFGQAGGAVVANLNGAGANELVFSSFDQNTLAIWTRDSTTPAPPTPPAPTPTTDPKPPTTTPIRTVHSSLRIAPGKRSVKAGKLTTWALRLKGAPGGPRRTVKVVFDPARGKTVTLRTVRLSKTAKKGVQRGTITWRPKKKGRLVVVYAGKSVSSTLRDTRARDVARVIIR